MKINVVEEEPRQIQVGDIYVKRSPNKDTDKHVIVIASNYGEIWCVSLSNAKVYGTFDSIDYQEDIRLWLQKQGYMLCKDTELTITN